MSSKNKAKEVLLRLMKFIKFGGLIPQSTQDTTAVARPTKPYLRRFILMTSCRTETVSQIQKTWPFSCCCSHQSVALLFLCLCQGSRWTFWAHFVVFLWSVCYVSAENFWIWGFTVWLFCLSPKRNLSETFYQVWALRRWRRWHNHRQTLKSCLLNRCAKLVFSCGLMTLC